MGLGPIYPCVATLRPGSAVNSGLLKQTAPLSLDPQHIGVQSSYQIARSRNWIHSTADNSGKHEQEYSKAMESTPRSMESDIRFGFDDVPARLLLVHQAWPFYSLRALQRRHKVRSLRLAAMLVLSQKLHGESARKRSRQVHVNGKSPNNCQHCQRASCPKTPATFGFLRLRKPHLKQKLC